MKTQAVIFDMDGLLIDSEPLWQEAGAEALATYVIVLKHEDYIKTTGLRTPEWIDYWFRHFNITETNTAGVIRRIEDNALGKILQRGTMMPGVQEIITFLHEKKIDLAIASSSPYRMIEAVIGKLNIGAYLKNYTSAESLAYGKPHPQVFIECANVLQANPTQCLVFEDSFNGMIAAKAAKMRCVVVPGTAAYHESRWDAADAKMRQLGDFEQFTTLFE